MLGCDISKGIPAWRRKYFSYISSPLVRLWLRYVFHIEEHGDKSCDGPHGRANIIVMNHTAEWDILLMMGLAEVVPGFVSKAAVSKVWLIGYLADVWGSIYVDENRRAGGKATTKGASITEQITARGKVKDGRPLVIFPEGTTTNGEYTIPFRSGAFVGGHPVKPIATRYACTHFSPTLDAIGAVEHAFFCLTQFTNYVEITYLPVYYPSEEEKNDPKLYAANVQKLINEALGVTTIQASYKDKREYLKMLKEGKKNA
mmetsp:Transcript_8663/g.9653  ORF Transcript_8663/g.9653 Transcript_8663/m.9653 type:complete len:258 (+) Transcript_8663:3-776(+)